MDCFFPLDACGLNSQERSHSPSRKDGKVSKSRGRRRSRESRPKSMQSRDDKRGRSRSKSLQRLSGTKGTSRKETLQAPRKIVGAAYVRTAESIITSNDAPTLTTGRGNRSEDTGTTRSDSSSCCSSDDEDMTYPIQHRMSAQECSADQHADVASVANTDNVQDKTSPYSWFQPNFNKRAVQRASAGLTSPTNSVGAVKNTIKNKFDYIRKTRQFANPNFHDPPSDRSMATALSINAAEAGSLFARGFRYRRNDLARQILQRRHIDNSRIGFDP